MQRQGGNFLLQALLALALIIAFIPLFTQKLAVRDKDAQMHIVTSQIETASTAARIYLRENLGEFNYDTTILNGERFADTLEPYGLPLGFVPRTAFGQNISLVINKDEYTVSAYLELSGGNLSELQRAELVRRLGFYASTMDGNVYLLVPLSEVFSDVVYRKEKNVEENGFLSDLDLGGFGLENGGTVFARNGEFESVQANVLSIFGIEDGRKSRNKIDNLITVKSVFQSSNGETALTVNRGNLVVDSVSAKTLAKFGDTGNFTAGSASVSDLSMPVGYTSFVGPAKWDVKGNVFSDKITFNVERLEVSSSINAAHGQDVFINPEDLGYNTQNGIDVEVIRAANITLRDQTSDALSRGNSGAILLDIRPAGTSMFPDILLDSIDNNSFVIIANPADDSGKTVDCKSIILSYGGTYNQRSLSQNIICQYVFWQRLENRIDIKQCLLDGKSDCK